MSAIDSICVFSFASTHVNYDNQAAH